MDIVTFIHFDKYSGKLLQTLPYNQKSQGMKMNELNYDLHVGQALGLTGKIIAFLASLICGSLPITGLLIWIGKRKKSKYQTISTMHRLHKHKKNIAILIPQLFNIWLRYNRKIKGKFAKRTIAQIA